ncbi:MAG: type II toxin-antitoxin system VapC family toxin [Deltaproteobacteria bacterium]|nr:type II toxin-antitoxin system VapC family toxin [Deltaproteobacteria bacterium]
MILYLDTSSLLKLYVEEKDSAKVLDLLKSSEIAATSIVGYAEARSAFARKFREKAFTSRKYGRFVSTFNKDWDSYLIVKVTKEVVWLAGDLAERHSLKGLDAIHLSSAITLGKESSSPITFSCADRKLQKASKLEDLQQP